MDRKSEDSRVVDPTENVKALSEAANKRQDDLREALTKFVSAELQHVKDIGSLRASHATEIRHLETERINAIRQVDVTAVKTEADRALAAIQTLAATTATNADNLRTALTNTATTIAKQTADTVGEITTRIAALEKSSYEGVGKSRVADPQMAEFMTEMKGLMRAQAQGTGKSEGIGSAWAVLLGAAGLIATILTIGVIVFSLNRNSGQTAPQVIYVPAPQVTPVPQPVKPEK